MIRPYLSVLIPAYNEEINIRLGALDKVARYLEHYKKQYEVLVINDGSTDSTDSLVKIFVHDNPQFRMINNPHQGKALTVVSGMKEARGDIILFTDLDQATPLDQMEKILPWFLKGYDVVIGSRAGKREGAPFLRRFMAVGFMMLRGLILGLNGIGDTQCGFKAFTKNAVKDITDKLKLYGNTQHVEGSMVTAGFDIEVLFIAKKLGYKIREVPVEWHYVDTRRVSPIKDSIHGLLDIIQIRLNAIRGMYE